MVAVAGGEQGAAHFGRAQVLALAVGVAPGDARLGAVGSEGGGASGLDDPLDGGGGGFGAGHGGDVDGFSGLLDFRLVFRGGSGLGRFARVIGRFEGLGRCWGACESFVAQGLQRLAGDDHGEEGEGHGGDGGVDDCVKHVWDP